MKNTADRKMNPH